MEELLPTIKATTNGYLQESFEVFIDWSLQIIRIIGISYSVFFLGLFLFWFIMNVFLRSLSKRGAVLGTVHALLEYLFFPGCLLYMAWKVFALKRLNIPTRQAVSFGWGFTRHAITPTQPLKTFREAIIFFYSPILNLPFLILLFFPGGVFFKWMDEVTGWSFDFFYFFWIYLMLSIVLFGLPYMEDLFGPLQFSVSKTPEFYLFSAFYVIIAPITLAVWGICITILLSLIYAIVALYEVQIISRNETKRLSTYFDKYFEIKKKKEQNSPPVYILPDSEM